MRTLVTGATGLVGNNVVRLLLERGERVRVLVRDPKSRSLAGLTVETVPGDVTDVSSVEQASQDVQRIVHAAAIVHLGWTGMERQWAVNVEGTRNVANAAMRHGAKLIHVSSVDALGLGTRERPGDEEQALPGAIECPYVITKRAAEQVILEQAAAGLDAVIVNPVYMLGPWDWKPSSGRMLLQLSSGAALMAPPGGNDFCDVRDVAAGILTAAERGQPGRRYILGGEPLSYLQAWQMFAEVLGVRKPFKTIWRPGLFIASRVGDLLTWWRGEEGDVNSAAIAMSRKPHHFSYRRAAEELDYAPRPAREAAEAAWKWFREYGYA